MQSEKPVPVPDVVTQQYWDGARREELTLLRCRDCDTFVHPPKPTCTNCQSEAMEAAVVSGQGEIYSFSIMYNHGNPGFEDEVPYAVGIVHLAEQPGLKAIGNIVECNIDDIYIGMPVEVVFEHRSPEVTVPQFGPRK